MVQPPDKYGLALHTTSPQLGLALSNFTDDNRSQIWNIGRDLSSHLQQTLVDFLHPQAWTELEFIAVAKGPGSFTSTRIGIVSARTLAQQLDIPLFAISSLATFVWSEETCIADVPIAVKMEARRGQIFAGIYQLEANRTSLREHLPDTVMSLEAWQKIDLATNQLIDAPTKLGFTAPSLLELAYQQWQSGLRPHWSKALPFYGQHPVD